MTGAPGEDRDHRFDGQAEKVEVSEGEREERGDDTSLAAPVPADNAQQAARAARIRAARRAQHGASQ